MIAQGLPILTWVVCLVVGLGAGMRSAVGADVASPAAADRPAVPAVPAGGNVPASVRDVLTAEQWAAVEKAVDRGLAWMVTQQDADGSFRTRGEGQPGVTAICVMALLARGHVPGHGPYGERIDRAIDFVLTCQRPDRLISFEEPPAQMYAHDAAHTAIYNHAISGLMLTEVYGMTDPPRAARIRPVVERAIAFTHDHQDFPKRSAGDRGGWRYIRRWDPSDSDMSITAWQLMFLRSARNAGFEAVSEDIDEAMKYVQRCFDQRQGSFTYGLAGKDRHVTRAVAGAGILSLSLGGLHQTPVAQAAGDWLLEHSFDEYRGDAGLWNDSRYHYGAYYCAQAMFQLGGRHWAQFYPRLVRVLLDHQTPQGNWYDEPGEDWHYGHVYTTALSTLALNAPYQLLPIFQR